MLIILLLSESALKNVKFVKHRCSALITSDTSIREDKFSLSKRINGDEVVELSLFPQLNLEIMGPNVCLAGIKLDFATSSTDFCEAKIPLYDSFHYETKNNVFCCYSEGIYFPNWVSLFLYQ